MLVKAGKVSYVDYKTRHYLSKKYGRQFTYVVTSEYIYEHSETKQVIIIPVGFLLDSYYGNTFVYIIKEWLYSNKKFFSGDPLTKELADKIIECVKITFSDNSKYYELASKIWNYCNSSYEWNYWYTRPYFIYDESIDYSTKNIQIPIMRAGNIVKIYGVGNEDDIANSMNGLSHTIKKSMICDDYFLVVVLICKENDIRKIQREFTKHWIRKVIVK